MRGRDLIGNNNDKNNKIVFDVMQNHPFWQVMFSSKNQKDLQLMLQRETK